MRAHGMQYIHTMRCIVPHRRGKLSAIGQATHAARKTAGKTGAVSIAPRPSSDAICETPFAHRAAARGPLPPRQPKNGIRSSFDDTSPIRVSEALPVGTRV